MIASFQKYFLLWSLESLLGSFIFTWVKVIFFTGWYSKLVVVQIWSWFQTLEPSSRHLEGIFLSDRVIIEFPVMEMISNSAARMRTSKEATIVSQPYFSSGDSLLMTHRTQSQLKMGSSIPRCWHGKKSVSGDCSSLTYMFQDTYEG